MTGSLCVYAAVSPSNTGRVIDMIRGENEKLIRESVTREEFSKIKKQALSGLIMGRESTSSRMHSLGQKSILGLRIRTPDEIEKEIGGITLDEITDVARIVFREECGIGIVGNASLLPEVKLLRSAGA